MSGLLLDNSLVEWGCNKFVSEPIRNGSYIWDDGKWVYSPIEEEDNYPIPPIVEQSPKVQNHYEIEMKKEINRLISNRTKSEEEKKSREMENHWLQPQFIDEMGLDRSQLLSKIHFTTYSRLHRDIFPYEMEGYFKMDEAKYCRFIIAYEMGISNTIPALSYAIINNRRPVLIICSANLKYNWQQEIRKLSPSSTAQVINSDKTRLISAEFYIINFDLTSTLVLDELLKLNSRMIIIDEAHYLNNEKAKSRPHIMSLVNFCPSVVFLSSLDPSKNQDLFKKLEALVGGYDVKTLSGNKDVSGNIIRKTKACVSQQLPDYIFENILLNLSEEQLGFYQQSLKKLEEEMNLFNTNKSISNQQISMLFGKLITDSNLLKINHIIGWISGYITSTEKKIIILCSDLNRVEFLNHLLSMSYNCVKISQDMPSEIKKQLMLDFEDQSTNILIIDSEDVLRSFSIPQNVDTILTIEKDFTKKKTSKIFEELNLVNDFSDYKLHMVEFSARGTIDEYYNQAKEKLMLSEEDFDSQNIEHVSSIIRLINGWIWIRLKSDQDWQCCASSL